MTRLLQLVGDRPQHKTHFTTSLLLPAFGWAGVFHCNYSEFTVYCLFFLDFHILEDLSSWTEKTAEKTAILTAGDYFRSQISAVEVGIDLRPHGVLPSGGWRCS